MSNKKLGMDDVRGGRVQGSANGSAMAHKGKDRRNVGDKQEGKEGAGEEGGTHGIIKSGIGSGE